MTHTTHNPHDHHHDHDTERPPLLAARGLTYTYPGASLPALSAADFGIAEGQRMGVIGHNGSGKTTLFHLLMGLIRPETGTIEFDGKTVRTEKDFQGLRRQVGFLFQQSDDQLFSPTVIEDVAFGPLNLGMTGEEARATATRTLQSLGLAGFENRITHRLSGGEKKMVALASVLAMQPRVLLLDEPTNDLDPDTREHLITRINALPVTRCIISHDWDFLERTCDRFVTLKHGAIHVTTHVPHVHVHVHDGGDVEHKHEDCAVLG